MKIGILGTGNMGSPLGTLATQAGNTVKFGSRHPENPVLQAIEGTDMVILAVPYAAAIELAENEAIRAALAGKIVVDITNPLAQGKMGLTIGFSTSAAEEIARRLPGIRVVKAFNTIFSDALKRRAEGAAVRATVFVAGDDDDAKRATIELTNSFGLSAVDSGSLSTARYLEPATGLLIELAYGEGMGRGICLSLLNSVDE